MSQLRSTAGIGMAVVGALALLLMSGDPGAPPGTPIPPTLGTPIAPTLGTPMAPIQADDFTPLQHGGGSCGDQRCQPPEDCNSCPQDCGSCCGDGHCRPPEDCNSCPRDCGSC